MRSHGRLVGIAAAVCLLFAICRPGGAAVYVVDTAAPGAADANPGTEAKPFKTIQKGADVAQAGDTVAVCEGNYPERVTLKNSGAEGKPIVFRSCLPRGAELYGFNAGKVDWVRIEGFRIRPLKPERMVAGVFVAGSHVDIVDNYFQGLYQAICLDYSVADKTKEPVSPSDIHIAYNEIYQCQECVWLFGRRCVFENNYVHRVTNQIGSGDADYMRPYGVDQTIRYNTMGGTKLDEIGGAHLDICQYFDTNGHHGRRFDVSYNVLTDFGELFMGEMKHSADLAGDWTFHHNIGSKSWAWAICNIGIPRVRTANNTFYDIKWNGVGTWEFKSESRHNKAEGCVIQNNIMQKIGQAMSTKGDANPQRDHNMIFQCGTNAVGEKDLVNVDPKMVDPANGNFRLQKGSPAIGVGEGGVTIGALEYPNVYYADPRHPAATDDGFGYAGQPYKTVAKALSVAQTGETVVLRGGTYRETLKPLADGVTIRAAEGEKVIVTGADLVTGWKRDGDGWSAPMADRPGTPLLVDGQAKADLTWDEATKTVRAKGFDPRLHVIERIVREHGIDLRGRKDVSIAGVDVTQTSGEAIVK
jgi:hypothetical protein